MSVPSSSPESKPKFRVAICGAGIGGLVLAITIGKYNPSIPIDLYEAHASLDTPGVGIVLWRKARKVLIDLDLLGDFKQFFTRSPITTCMRRADIREGGYPWFQRTSLSSSMHRQQMVAILERHLPASCTTHFKKRLVNYVEPDQDNSTSPIRLEFADGTVATTDVLLGADGIRSGVRRTMFEAASKDDGDGEKDFGQYIDAIFTGMTVYRSLVSAEVLRKESPENISLKGMSSYVGKGRYLVTYPIVQGTIINIVAMVCDPSLRGTHYEGHWVSDAPRDELVEYFDGFEPDARTVVKLCEKLSKWALHVVKPLPFCVRKRVVLIGDACHAMTPHFGAGANQAIEDAYILGRLIAHPLTSLPCVQDTLRIYEEIRFPFARSIASLSLSTGWMYTFLAPGYYDGTRNEDDVDDRGIGAYERDGMETIKQEIFKRWDIMDESRGALEMWEDAEWKLQTLAGKIASRVTLNVCSSKPVH